MISGNSKTGWVIAFFSGLAIGAALGILFAPKSGKELRNNIKDNSEKIIKTGKESVSEVVEKTKEFVESGKEKIDKLKDLAK